MKIRVWIRTDNVGSKYEDVIEVDDAEWVRMTDAEKEEDCRAAAFDHMDWGFEEVQS